MVRSPIGNCNITYIDGLRSYNYKDMAPAMKDLLTAPSYGNYGFDKPAKSKPTFYQLTQGIILFAQGSEDSIKTNPYAHAFKKFIEDNGLGVVTETPPAPNPGHNRKPGYLFAWVLNPYAMRNWWDKHVGNTEPTYTEAQVLATTPTPELSMPGLPDYVPSPAPTRKKRIVRKRKKLDPNVEINPQ